MEGLDADAFFLPMGATGFQLLEEHGGDRRERGVYACPVIWRGVDGMRHADHDSFQSFSQFDEKARVDAELLVS